jgi:tRNA pseudouridine55 synthase
MDKLNGILVLNKPKGMTSHDCVAKIRRLAKTKRVGHTGTLDPQVTGVLPICLGHATRVAEYLLEYQKEYTADISLGVSTTTQDQSGEEIENVPLTVLPSEAELRETLSSFEGNILQIPPMYSAVKIGGKRLHQLAREGKEIERAPREVTIYGIKLLNYIQEKPYPTFSIQVRCSKGTYIRTLGVDIGQKMGHPAHMSSLVRSKSGPFTLEESISFEEIEQWSEEEWLVKLLPMDSALASIPSLVLSHDLIERVKNGQSLRLDTSVEENQLYRVYDQSHNFIAIYTGQNQHVIKPKKVFLF